MIIVGDALTELQRLPDESVHCVVTSPPYWGLRDYSANGQFGLEATPEEYIAKMVAVFREVRRVLRRDGTLWCNMGDSYSTGGAQVTGYNDPDWIKTGGRCDGGDRTVVGKTGLKPKDLCGMPWRLAFALQADGWWLRSDIIWAKPNPMPESVTDRPTKAHEYVFLLSKAARYFYDAEAIREDGAEPDRQREDRIGGANGHTVRHSPGAIIGASATRNARTVWTIATQPFPEAHFATFPEALAERCIRAGTSERGCCPTCGAPWVRVVERTAMVVERSGVSPYEGHDTRCSGKMVSPPTSETTGWRPSCTCAADPVPCTVLDPFGGAGTVGLVAAKLNRDYVLIEIKPEYAEMAKRRIYDALPLFAGVTP